MGLKYARAQSKLSHIKTALRLIDGGAKVWRRGVRALRLQKILMSQCQYGAGGELHDSQNVFPVQLGCIHGGRGDATELAAGGNIACLEGEPTSFHVGGGREIGLVGTDARGDPRPEARAGAQIERLYGSELSGDHRLRKKMQIGRERNVREEHSGARIHFGRLEELRSAGHGSAPGKNK